MDKKQRLILILGAIILSNLLGILSIQGPMQISFSMTALPIYLIALSMGWEIGYITGLLGGITQALHYGSIWYVFYTAIIGAVSGYIYKNHHINRKWGNILFSTGIFFMFMWIVFINQYFLASEVFVILISLIMFVTLEYNIIKKHLAHNPLLNITLAGCAGAAAYIPFNIIVMALVQRYPMVPLFIILAKDLVQDYTAAILAAVLMQTKAIKSIMNQR